LVLGILWKIDMKTARAYKMIRIIIAYCIVTIILADYFLPGLAETALKDAYYVMSDPETAELALQQLADSKSILGTLYLKDEYIVREKADTYSSKVAILNSGDSLYLTGAGVDDKRNIWYKVNFDYEGKQLSGYIEREFITSSDTRFLNWENTYITTADREAIRKEGDCSDIECFPDEYKDALYTLKAQHPNWTFVKQNINISWSTVLYQENLNERSLISKSADSSYKKRASTGTDGWYVPTDDILAYYLDTRNFLTETTVFMFEQESFNRTVHTREGVQSIVNGTFMSGEVEDSGISYAETFYDIGEEFNVSPMFLASRVRQEQGVKGTSPLISGKYSGFEGYYNYFNIKANGSTKEQIYINGLTYAKEKGWNTRTKSLRGGAEIIAYNYIRRGQDTLYLQKFDVDDSDKTLYTHQYMQNIVAPYSESVTAYKGYKNEGLLESPFVFKIPVYNNMPSQRCIKPNESDILDVDVTNITNLPVDRSAVVIPKVNGTQVDNTLMTYISSNENVAVVNDYGVITGVNPGNAVISIKRTENTTNTVTCNVSVIKADIAVSDIPELEIETTYFSNLKLADLPLPDDFEWENENLNPVVDNQGYNIVYNPDSSKYNEMTVLAKVNVTPALLSNGEIELPQNLEGYSGAELDSVVLPDGYVWYNREELLPKSPGSYMFKAMYSKDASVYEVSDIEVAVKVVEIEKEQVIETVTSDDDEGKTSVEEKINTESQQQNEQKSADESSKEENTNSEIIDAGDSTLTADKDSTQKSETKTSTEAAGGRKSPVKEQGADIVNLHDSDDENISSDAESARLLASNEDNEKETQIIANNGNLNSFEGLERPDNIKDTETEAEKENSPLLIAMWVLLGIAILTFGILLTVNIKRRSSQKTV